jgi:hypothetical protein
MQFKPRAYWINVFLVMSIFLIAGLADPAFAGPGGILKAAAQTVWGQIGMGILVLIFAPVIIVYITKRFKHLRKVHKDLDALATLYPQYRWLDLRDKTTEIYQWVWSAWSQEKMSLASEHTTHWYWQNQQLVLNQWERDGLENYCRLERIKSIEPLYVEHIEENNGNGSRVVVEVNAMVIDYMKERATGKVVMGDKKVGELETIWTFVWQDGRWLLNLIEDYTQEGVYLGMPNKLPAALQQPESAAVERAS